MGTGSIRKLAALCALVLAAWLAPVAAAQVASPVPTCHAGADHEESYAAVAADPKRWNCESNGWSARAEKTFLRFDVSGQAAPPTRFVTRLTRFAEMSITVVDADGSIATRHLMQDEMRPSTSDWQMDAALPMTAAPPRTVIVEIHKPRFIGMLSDARLESTADRNGNGFAFELLIAALCGMLCMPLLLNLAFFKVLRERFLLWHSGVVCFMLVQTLVTSGLINRFLDLTVLQLSVLSAGSFGCGIASAMLFAADLMEEGTVDARHRRLLRLTAPWIVCWTLFYLSSGESLRPITPGLYYLSWLPVLGVMGWGMAVARERGSRAVKFQMVAWAPFILTGLTRMASVLGLTDAPLEMQAEQHMAIAFEVIVTAMGVADRFLVLKHQRDSAWAQARMLEDRVERDPLTGLLNRHAIEHRFEALHAQGYRTVAVLDLDRFKEINDTFGHAVGDMVLRAVGTALAPDDHTIAIRLGGEEFMLLLSGPSPIDEAERRRHAVAVRIAAEVPGLDRLVTASMGLVEYGTRTRVQPDFATAYAHCDRLLYDAKRAGRNRMMLEKVRGFSPPAMPVRARS